MTESLDHIVPLYLVWQHCGSGYQQHQHLTFGVMCKTPPYPGETAWANEDEDEFFYPFSEILTCMN